MKPFISVIMAVYNGEDFLESSILGVVNQKFKNWEFIIVNDGSTDGSKDVIEKYSKNDSRIICIDQENRGLTKSLNVAISHARGKYIARQDADDISLPDRFQKFVDFVERNGEVDFYSTPAFRLNELTGEQKIIPWYPRRNGFHKNMLKYSNSMIHGALIVSGDILREVRYNEAFRFSQDFELYHRLMNKGYVLSYDKDNISYLLRFHGSSISELKKTEQLDCYKRVFNDNKLPYYPPALFNRILFKLMDIFFYLKK